jgi:hypothetical protein
MDYRGTVSDYGLGIWFLKESDLVPGYLDYFFGYTPLDTEKDDQSYIWYRFSRDDLQAITFVQTMIAILEKHDNGEPRSKLFH